MASAKKLTLKLLVDKEKKRVVFAESDKDFVDILFSFLTMPMGTIIRLLDKQSSLGCMDKLYESVEKLDTQYFQTEACKTMLLRPLSASGCLIENLVLNIDDIDPREFYTCPKAECCIDYFRFFSSVQNARCSCGQIMDFRSTWAEKDPKESNGDGVFVKGMMRFIISDDLHVMPASTAAILNLLDKLGIKDGSILEERTIDLGRNELLNLLKRLLLSKSPLSGICFQEADIIDNASFYTVDRIQPKLEEDSATAAKEFKAKFLVNKSSNKVLYAEAGEGLVDLLVSFLTFPLGSIVKLLEKHSSIGCVDNLYDSVESLSTCNDYMKSYECKNMLLAPKLAPYFGCSNAVLPNNETLAGSGTMPGCHTCYLQDKDTLSMKCMHGVEHVSLDEMNPKQPAGKEIGGGFARVAVKLMITDDIEIAPFSPLASIQTANRTKSPFTSLEEREFTIGESEALNLLKTCLNSRSSLSDVFLSRKRKRVQ